MNRNYLILASEQPYDNNELTPYTDNNMFVDKQGKMNFCSIHRRVERGELSIENALRGLNISTASFTIPDTKPDIGVMMLDAISKRAGFLWKHSNEVISLPMANETYTDVLSRNTLKYDIVIDWWARNIQRLLLGLVYTESWYDADTIMMRRRIEQEEIFNVFATFLPFTSGLWLLIAITVVVTGAVHYLLDYLYCRCHEKSMDDAYGGPLFNSCQMFMGQCSYTPKARASRILTLSSCFISLILIAAFTANLANFFIMKTSSQHEINSIADVLSNDLQTCSQRAIVLTENFKVKYPQAKLREYESQDELFIAVSEGLCDVGLTTMEIYKEKSRDKAFNKYCSLEWIGRRVESSIASFALADSEQLCTSIFRNALDVHIIQMTNDGTLDLIWKAYRDQVSSNTCNNAKVAEEKVDDGRLSILNLGGVFVFHGILIVVSIIIATYEFYRNPIDVREEVKKDMKEVFREKSFRSLRISCRDLATTAPIENGFLNKDENYEMFVQARADLFKLKKQADMLQRSNEQIYKLIFPKDQRTNPNEP